MSDNLLAAHDAADRYNQSYLRDFYQRREAAIRASGDPIRIRLMNAFFERDRERNGKAA